MRNCFDQLAKQILEFLLGQAGPVKVQQEIPADAQWIDVWFPAKPPANPTILLKLGLLGRLAQGPCLFEAFSKTPSPREARSCLRKLYSWHNRLCERVGRDDVALPALWLLSPGYPEGLISGFDLKENAKWEPGVYRSHLKELGLGVIVLPDLALGRETLPLRLLGRGATLREAVEELRRLPATAWEKFPLQKFLAKTRVMLQEQQDELTPEEEETIMILEKTFEEYEQAVLDRGMEKAYRDCAIRLLIEGEPLERVARLTGLKLEDVQKISLSLQK